MKYFILGFCAFNSVLLLLTIKKQNKMSVTLEQFDGVLNRIDVATTNIANELRDIKDQVKKYGLPAEAETNIFNRLEAAATQLEAIGKQDSSPVAESPVAQSPVAESPVTESPVSESPVTDGSVSPATDIV